MSSNLIAPEQLLRPKTRADCVDGPRPCPWVGCVHHLALEVDGEDGTIKMLGRTKGKRGRPRVLRTRAGDEEVRAFGDRVVELLDVMVMTCELDVTDEEVVRGRGSNADVADDEHDGARPYQVVGDAVGVSKQRAERVGYNAEQGFRAAWEKAHGSDG